MTNHSKISSSIRASRSALLVGAGLLAMFATATPFAGATQVHSTVRSPHAAMVIPASTKVVALTQDLQGYATPGGKVTRTVSHLWLGVPLITPVLATSGAYVEIRLPMRPNMSVIWVKSATLLFSVTPYYIVVNTKTTHLALYKNGKLVVNAPVGTGTNIDPTPTGRFFVTFFAASDGDGYGPWEMMTSAHSLAISDWSGTGDALISVHGPLFSDAQIGTTGTHISHGCIRLHSADQLKLGNVTPGTPFIIVNQ